MYFWSYNNYIIEENDNYLITTYFIIILLPWFTFN